MNREQFYPKTFIRHKSFNKRANMVGHLIDCNTQCENQQGEVIIIKEDIKYRNQNYTVNNDNSISYHGNRNANLNSKAQQIQYIESERHKNNIKHNNQKSSQNAIIIDQSFSQSQLFSQANSSKYTNKKKQTNKQIEIKTTQTQVQIKPCTQLLQKKQDQLFINEKAQLKQLHRAKHNKENRVIKDIHKHGQKKKKRKYYLEVLLANQRIQKEEKIYKLKDSHENKLQDQYHQRIPNLLESALYQTSKSHQLCTNNDQKDKYSKQAIPNSQLNIKYNDITVVNNNKFKITKGNRKLSDIENLFVKCEKKQIVKHSSHRLNRNNSLAYDQTSSHKMCNEALISSNKYKYSYNHIYSHNSNSKHKHSMTYRKISTADTSSMSKNTLIRRSIQHKKKLSTAAMSSKALGDSSLLSEPPEVIHASSTSNQENSLNIHSMALHHNNNPRSSYNKQSQTDQYLERRYIQQSNCENSNVNESTKLSSSKKKYNCNENYNFESYNRKISVLMPSSVNNIPDGIQFQSFTNNLINLNLSKAIKYRKCMQSIKNKKSSGLFEPNNGYKKLHSNNQNYNQAKRRQFEQQKVYGWQIEAEDQDDINIQSSQGV